MVCRVLPDRTHHGSGNHRAYPENEPIPGKLDYQNREDTQDQTGRFRGCIAISGQDRVRAARSGIQRRHRVRRRAGGKEI